MGFLLATLTTLTNLTALSLLSLLSFFHGSHDQRSVRRVQQGESGLQDAVDTVPAAVHCYLIGSQDTRLVVDDEGSIGMAEHGQRHSIEERWDRHGTTTRNIGHGKISQSDVVLQERLGQRLKGRQLQSIQQATRQRLEGGVGRYKGRDGLRRIHDGIQTGGVEETRENGVVVEAIDFLVHIKLWLLLLGRWLLLLLRATKGDTGAGKHESGDELHIDEKLEVWGE